jgi:two-component system sensor histidine kinase KdpD
MAEGRPDPDELLARAQAEEAAQRRGRLKIFFGASPGVGKTFAMLSEARRLRTQGQDILIGVVETHGRSETAVLMEGLEILPLKAVEHRGQKLREFDLDAALARAPAVILVDELAHTNAPGCRHPKRWQDVEELQGAGIDVLTTVNVQHIESLNDIVGGITGIRIRETLPDRIFAEAGEVVLVDLPPDDLLVRLREGKVYLPDQAERAIQNFFRKGNLIALRELALRLTADRVDDQVRAFRRASAEMQVWRTSDALLACIGPNDLDEKVARAGARLAARLDCNWHAVYVETPDLQRLSEAHRQRILRTLKLAQELGAETATLPAQDRVEAVRDYLRRHNLGRAVVGRSTRKRWRWPGRQGFAERLGREAPDIELVAVARDNGRARDAAAWRAKESDETPLSEQVPGYLYAAALCVAVTALATPLLPYFELANIVMLYLLAIMIIAVRFGRGPAVSASVLGVLCFDFFFVPPRFTLAVADVQYLLTFAVMLTVGLVIGHLTAGLRYQVRVARHREERSRSLSDLARSLLSALVAEQVAEISDKYLKESFQAEAAILLPDASDKLQPPAGPSPRPSVDMAIAVWCYDHDEPAGAGTDTLPASPQLYLPLKAPMRVRGVLVIEPRNPRLLMIPEQRRQLETFATLAAIALERIHFVTVAQETLIKMESERLRNSLLAALSHDLRTPLTALMGVSETLSRSLAAAGSEHSGQADLIREQAARTARLVDNLLEMARIQSGELKPRKDWQSLEEIVGGALKALEPSLGARAVQVDLAADLPLVKCDPVLIERVLVNLLENAIKYTDDGIGIAVRKSDGKLEIEVRDQGPGLPEGEERALFLPFTRGQKESGVPGAGLGLAICAAIVDAHGGAIRAENHPGGGAQFLFTLPLEAQPVVDPESEPPILRSAASTPGATS